VKFRTLRRRDIVGVQLQRTYLQDGAVQGQSWAPFLFRPNWCFAISTDTESNVPTSCAVATNRPGTRGRRNSSNVARMSLHTRRSIFIDLHTRVDVLNKNREVELPSSRKNVAVSAPEIQKITHKKSAIKFITYICLYCRDWRTRATQKQVDYVRSLIK
jgi:hypothetical protein